MDSQVQFMRVLEFNPLAMAIATQDGRIEYLNRKAILSLGYQLSDIPDIDHWSQLAYPDPVYREQVAVEWRGLISEAYATRNEIAPHEYQVTCKDGRVKTMAIGGVWIAERLLVIFDDITDRKVAEDALKEAKAVAESASVAKSAFLANMSHEIRTPMNAIMGLTQLLRRSHSEPERLDKLGQMTGAANHLMGLINDILDISKIEAGKVALEEIDFDVDEMLSRVSSIVTQRAHAKGVELVVDVQGLPATLKGDPTRLSQMLINYLGNAVKFTEHGSIILRGRVLETTKEEYLVRFEVEDSGMGIAAEQLTHIFEAFDQADSSMPRRYGGTGLGLAITKHIVEMMGGACGVDSVQGKGSTFWLTARLRRADTLVEPQAPFAATGLRVLVADDLLITQMVHSQLLGQMGMRVVSVGSGREAVAAIKQGELEDDPFALAFIDLLMPDIDGITALHEIQALGLQEMPVCLLVTATADEDALASARAAGYVDLIHKPLSAKFLRNWLENYFSEQKKTDEPAPEPSEEVLRREFTGKRILLVEDEPLNQLLAEEMLGDVGLDVFIANNGQEACDLVLKTEYDLILMDMQMPVMDGLTATRQIRQLEHGRLTPIIAMTANAFAEDRARCMDAGMDDFVSKPVDTDVLFLTLLKWLRSGRSL